MSNLPALALAVSAIVIGIVNLAYFRGRPAWSGAALAFAGALGATAAGAEREWWFIVPQLAITAWGLAFLIRTASGKREP